VLLIKHKNNIVWSDYNIVIIIYFD